MHPTFQSGNSSAGRARPCQGRGREFESRFPLQYSSGGMAEWLCSGLQIRGSRFDSGFRLHLSSQICARVVKLVDTRDLKSLVSNDVPVQVRPRAPFLLYRIDFNRIPFKKILPLRFSN